MLNPFSLPLNCFKSDVKDRSVSSYKINKPMSLQISKKMSQSTDIPEWQRIQGFFLHHQSHIFLHGYPHRLQLKIGHRHSKTTQMFAKRVRLQLQHRECREKNRASNLQWTRIHNKKRSSSTDWQEKIILPINSLSSMLGKLWTNWFKHFSTWWWSRINICLNIFQLCT